MNSPDALRPHDRQREQERLYAIAAAANAARDLDEILLLIRNAIIEVSGFDRVGIWLMENEVLIGAWGTDETGKLRDEHNIQIQRSDFVPPLERVLTGNSPYAISPAQMANVPALGPTLSAFQPGFGVIGLRAHGQLMGVIFLDNLLSGRPLTAADLEALLPFCEQVAVAIANARLLAEQQRLVARQRRLSRLAAAISSRTALHEILRMVHDAIIEAGGFDRTAVFLYDREHNLLRGTWGTDRSGEPVDISEVELPILPGDTRAMARLARGEMDYYLSANYTAEVSIPPDHPMYGVHAHAIVPLRVGTQIVGMVAVDNLLRDAPITAEDMDGLLPFADQAAVAIQNAQLFQALQQAQTALLRSEKLRAVGELASGVAHNVNNVLAAVLGYAELIQMTEGAPAEIKHYARTIERAALDGAAIVQRLQQFARKETEANEERFDLSVLAREAIELTRPAWHNQAAGRGARIEVQAELQPELWVAGVASELREVFINLICNAADAMPEGGTLTVRSFVEHGLAVVAVQDTGVGMDESTLRRVFEPFFTTKPPGRGTGLGLSVAWGIVDRHRGRIEVESQSGQGAVFRVYLPLTRQAAPDSAAADDSATLLKVRILLVEDEELVLDGLARALAAQGATLGLASDASEALEWLKANGDTCDLILSDHGMAGLTGMELLVRVRERWPHIRRVLLSGWGAHLPGKMDTSAAELILTKPIRQKEMTAALAQLLASSPDA
ncbi:MAG TPA: ATP-binding protein [Chthonomonadaceae bacterium]|nr:ATP-binding protein [Chthonomonadaceae bacterium]